MKKRELNNKVLLPDFTTKTLLLMLNWTISLTFLLVLEVSANSYSQNVKVNLDFQNVKFKKAFPILEQKGNIRLLYSEENLLGDKSNTLSVRNTPVMDVLGMEDKLAVTSPKNEVVADIIVRGQVTDPKGETLPGVNVRVKGTTTVSTTDMNGRYVISVPQMGAVLVFSYVGFTSVERTVSANSPINVVLTDQSNTLNEVVVVGFGTQTKASSVAAVSTVTAVDLVKAPTGDVTNALVGRMAGVMTRQRQGRPGESGAEIYIRGRASENSQALIIVDGVEREGFGEIDPNDIESISTLKDAASTALFGLKGANGVIVVTTKRGVEGRPKVSFSTQFGLNTLGAMPKPLRAYEAAVVHSQAEDNLIRAGLLGATYQKFFTPQDIETFRSGTGDPLLYPDVDWFDELLRDVWPRHQHNISLRGGSKKLNYFVSAGYMYEDGMFKLFDSPLGYRTSPFAKRTNFRSNLDYKLTPTTTLSLNLGGRIENEHTLRPIKYGQSAEGGFTNGAEAVFKWITIAPTWSMPFDRDAAQRKTPEQIAKDDTYNQIIGVGFGGAGVYMENPYINIKRGGYVDSEKNILESTFMINQKLDFITKGLDIVGTFAYDQNSQFNLKQNGTGANFTVDRATGQVIPAYATPAAIRIEDPLTSNSGVAAGLLKTNMQVQANYKRTFNNHNVSGALVATRQISHLTALQAPRAFQGLVFRTTYNFNDKYYTEFNGSYQGSENFDKGYRYGFFPTLGLGYTLSNEGFMKNINKSIGLDYLKIRGSVGTVGYANASSRFLYLDEYATSGTVPFGHPTSISNVPLYAHTRLGNPFATFEKGFKRNIGIDANFFNNRVQITADLFDEKRTDILLPKRESTFDHYGENLPIYNYGENYNGGYEAELKLNNRRGAFGYGLNFQFSHIKNKQLILDEPINQTGNLRLSGISIGQFFAYDVVPGFFQNQAEIDAYAKMDGFPFIPGDIKLKDVNGDGFISPDDYTSIGYSDVPIDQYSLEPHISYKGFSLSALFQAADKVSNEFNLTETSPVFVFPVYYEHQKDSWTPQNPNAKYPAVRPTNIAGNRFFGRTDTNGGNDGVINAFNLQDASYIKLRNVSLHYAIPQKLVSKFGMSQAAVSLTGYNLYTWTKFIGMDPENGDNTREQTYLNRGITYPNVRTYQINLNITL